MFDGQYGNIFVVGQFVFCVYFNGFYGGFLFGYDIVFVWVMDIERIVVFVLCGKYEVLKFCFIYWCGNNYIWDIVYVSEVVCVVMGGIVCFYKFFFVEIEDYMQVLQCYVMQYLVVGVLYK